MKFLNGFKTIIGLAGTVLGVILPKIDSAIITGVGDHVYGIAQGVFGLLLTLGLIHKAEKRSGVTP